MTTRRPLLVVTVAVLGLFASSARADDSDATRRRDRTIFYAALGVTGVGLATWVYGGSRVLAAQEDLDELAARVAYEQNYTPDGDGRVDDVCALAEGGDGPASQEAQSTCKRGKRWQTIATASSLVTLGSAVVTAVFAYRAFRSPDSDQRAPAASKTAWRAQPIATPTAVGLGVDVEF